MLPALLLSFAAAAADSDIQPVAVTVDGVKREALVRVPPKASKPAPVVFCWHGHGGTMRHSSRVYPFPELMPDALCVFPQGLPTPGLTDKEGKKFGWQQKPGDQADRDVKFFDALFEKLKKEHTIDANRVYSTGHSNGGAFSYVLWATRPDAFAAIAPSAAGMIGVRKLKPMPVLHVIGTEDTIVSPKFQNFVIEAVKETNKAEAKGKEWAKEGPITATLFPAKAGGADTVIASHGGGHNYPPEAPKLIAKFFAEHVKK